MKKVYKNPYDWKHWEGKPSSYFDMDYSRKEKVVASSTSKDGNYRNITVEQDIYVKKTASVPFEYCYTIQNKRKQYLGLCIGGPLDGERYTFSELRELDKHYQDYNAASRNRIMSMVFIHESILKGKK